MERQYGALSQAAAGQISAGAGTPALFLDQQRPLVGDRRAQGLSSRCAGEETGGRKLLSRGHDQGRVRGLGEDALSRVEASGGGLLYRNPPPPGQKTYGHSLWAPTLSPAGQAGAVVERSRRAHGQRHAQE